MQKKRACEKMLFRNIWETKRVTGFEYVQNTLYTRRKLSKVYFKK